MKNRTCSNLTPTGKLQVINTKWGLSVFVTTEEVTISKEPNYSHCKTFYRTLFTYSGDLELNEETSLKTGTILNPMTDSNKNQ